MVEPVPMTQRQRTYAQLRHDVDVMQLALQGLQSTMQQIANDCSSIKKTVGETETDEHGKLIGTGIAGDLGRLRERVDDRFRRYDGWVKYGAGFSAALVMFGAVLWWLVENRLEFLR